MKKIRSNVWLIIAVVIAAVLLLWWLFIGTTLEEDVEPVTQPVGACIKGSQKSVPSEVSLLSSQNKQSWLSEENQPCIILMETHLS